MPSLGPMELLLILGIVILIFGAGKVADIGGALGKSVREFRRAVEDEPTAPPPPPPSTQPAGQAGETADKPS